MHPNPNTVYGGFFIRQEGNDLYYSEYLEHNSDTPFQEIFRLTLSRDPNDPFVGTFTTSWLEPDGQFHTANVEITKHGLSYLLTWTDIRNNNEPTGYAYAGRAFRKGNELIGSYWSRPI